MNEVKFKIWVEKEGEMFLGNGRVKLLSTIAKLGSISSAARQMGMSYSKAWEQVQHMNSLSKTPLVEKVSGGKGGGGTVLTEEGKRLVSAFRSSTEQIKEFINKEFNQ